jgi:hypothetical protein
MSTGPHPTVNGSPALALAPKPEDTPEGGTVLGDLKEVKEGVVSLGRLWGRLSGGSKAAVGGAVVTLLGPLALTIYTHAGEVWGQPAVTAALAEEFEDHREESRREHEQIRAVLDGIARKVGAPTSAPASQP